MQDKQERKPQPPVWAEVVLVAATMAGNFLLIWSQLPPAERDNLTLTVRQWCQSTARRLDVRAWQAGHAGMADELAGRQGDAAVRYVAAAWLGRWRDRIGQVSQ